MFLRIAIAVLLACASQAQDKVQAKEPGGDNVARMEQILQSFVPQRFMGTVLVAREGKIILDKGYGFANLEWAIPNTPTTK